MKILYVILFLPLMASCAASDGSSGGNSSATTTPKSVCGLDIADSGVVSSNSATLNWAAPTTNADGTALSDLAGYKIYYWTTSPGNFSVLDVGNRTSFTIEGLSPDTYHFSVTAYSNACIESNYSDAVNKTIL